MRLFYTAFLLLLSAPSLFSQQIHFGPVQGNNVVRSYASQKQIELESQLERATGVNPRSLGDERGGTKCPPDLPFDRFIVESGGVIEIELDTFGLAIDSTPPTITMLTDPPLMFGGADYIEDINTVWYFANAGLLGIGVDTLFFQYTQAGVVDIILKIVVDIKRKGRTVIADGVTVDPGEVVQYCLDDELDFPNARCCYQFNNCFSDYDGKGNQFKYFYNDSCLVYIASRFPGTDTVCVEICDELAICDIFKIPFTIRGDTISLTSGGPFFEDFSTSNGPYPSQERWLDDAVYVNTTFAKNPPSVGMATFDGLDKGGHPYSLVNGGIGDKLTSKPIDLSSFTANDNVYLRFFVSQKGYGPNPEEDPFYVEFRNDQRKWIGIDTIEVADSVAADSVPPFVFYAIKIDDPAFLHDAFQMRFKAESSPGGFGDWWHLDYIHLADKSTDVNNFADFAFATLPEAFLKNYTSMPLRHLQADLENEIKTTPADRYEVTVSNRSTLNILNFSKSEVNLRNTNTGGSISGTAFTVASDSESQTAELSHKDIQVKLPDGNRTQLKNSINALSGNDPIHIETEFWFESNVTEKPEFRINDTVVMNTVLSDYFAHDDGSAELQVFWEEPQGGEEFAIKYKANVADSLRGIQFMFPHFTYYDVEAQFFNLKVWLGNENLPVGDPVYELELVKPFFTDNNYDTVLAFTTYKLEDIFGDATPLGIEAGQYFYVGFEQLTATSEGISIGYDINNPCKCNYGKRLTSWAEFGAFNPQGALMIRPVFRNVENSHNATTETNTGTSRLTIYPNPAVDLLNVKLGTGEYHDFQYVILNQLGQLVQKGEMQPAISLEGIIDGTYYLQTMKKGTGEIWMEKFVVVKK